jgi:CRP-like cAMP-binding protein
MAAPVLVPFRNIRPRLLEGLSQAELNAIISAAKQRRYLANSVMVNQEHPADYLFLLTSGRARYFYLTPDGRKTILLWLPPGEIFGGAALLSRPSEYLVSTEAVKPSSVLVWDRATIRDLVARYPRLTDNALLIMFDYLVAYRAIHASMTCHSARQRLAQVIAHLATGIGQKVSGGIELDVRNDELANEANVTPFTASRILSEWQRQGVLRKGRGKILLRSPERLFLQEF